MTLQSFNKLAAKIAKLNQVDIKTAKAWLSLIGDTPEFTDASSDLVHLPNSNNKTIHWPQ